jgi:hypothetical protein
MLCSSPSLDRSTFLPARSLLLEDDELAHCVLSERAAAVFALGQVLAPVRQQMVGLTVDVIDDRLEDLRRLQETAFEPAAKDGFPVGIRHERGRVGVLAPVARCQRQGPFHILA